MTSFHNDYNPPKKPPPNLDIVTHYFVRFSQVSSSSHKSTPPPPINSRTIYSRVPIKRIFMCGKTAKELNHCHPLRDLPHPPPFFQLNVVSLLGDFVPPTRNDNPFPPRTSNPLSRYLFPPYSKAHLKEFPTRLRKGGGCHLSCVVGVRGNILDQ